MSTSQDITDFLYKCIRTIYETDDISYNKIKVLNNFFHIVKMPDIHIENDNLWYGLYLYDEKLFVQTFLTDFYSYNWLDGKYINHHIISTLKPNVQKVFLWSIQKNDDILRTSVKPISYIETFEELKELMQVLLDILTNKKQDLSMFDNDLYNDVMNDMCSEIDNIAINLEQEQIINDEMEQIKEDLFFDDIEEYYNVYGMTQLDMYIELLECKELLLSDVDNKELKKRIEFLSINKNNSNVTYTDIINEYTKTIKKLNLALYNTPFTSDTIV